jgi:hypothetical protein
MFSNISFKATADPDVQDSVCSIPLHPLSACYACKGKERVDIAPSSAVADGDSDTKQVMSVNIVEQLGYDETAKDC